MKPAPREKDFDLQQEAWKKIDGKRCYVQRTIIFSDPELGRVHCISFPEKYLNKLPCIVKIEQRYKTGPNKNKLMYPGLYFLSKPDVVKHEIRLVDKNGKGGIQRNKCDGYVIPIKELRRYNRRKHNASTP